MESEYRAIYIYIYIYIPLFEQCRQNYSTNAWLKSTQTLLSDVNLLITVQKPNICYFFWCYTVKTGVSVYPFMNDTPIGVST